MKINYGINRRRVVKAYHKTRIEHQNGKLDLPQFEDVDFIDDSKNEAVHQKIRAEILAKHPGWNVTGYCTTKPMVELEWLLVRRNLANEIARELFINGQKELASQLVMRDETGANLGGWCESAVAKLVFEKLKGETYEASCHW